MVVIVVYLSSVKQEEMPSSGCRKWMSCFCMCIAWFLIKMQHWAYDLSGLQQVNAIFNPKQNGICPTNPLIRLQISHGFLQLQAQWILFLHLKIATVRTVGNLPLTTGICLTRTITTLGDHHLITFQWGQWTSLTIRWNIYCLKCCPFHGAVLLVLVFNRVYILQITCIMKMPLIVWWLGKLFLYSPPSGLLFCITLK